MVGRKKKPAAPVEEPVDLSSRIGSREAPAAAPPAPDATPSAQRYDGPIVSAVRSRPAPLELDAVVPQAVPSGRPTMIGLDEAPARTSAPSAPSGRPTMIGLEEALTAPPPRIAILDDEPAAEPPLLSVREAPEFGEVDLVATPLPTPDDWHHFELALRTLRGISELRTEYYRAGVLKVRVRWAGVDRFANAVRTVPGYRVRVLGEDRNTVQVLIGRR